KRSRREGSAAHHSPRWDESSPVARRSIWRWKRRIGLQAEAFASPTRPRSRRERRVAAQRSGSDWFLFHWLVIATSRRTRAPGSAPGGRHQECCRNEQTLAQKLMQRRWVPTTIR